MSIEQAGSTETGKVPSQSTGRGIFSWLFWWDLDQAKVAKQVEEYDTLKFYKSARGIGTLLCFLIATLTLGTVLRDHGFTIIGFVIDILLFYVFGIFMYFGHRWAIIGAMLLWTFEKGFIIVHTLPTIPYLHLLWWAIFMHQFWLAFKVENRRKNQNLPIVKSVKDPNTIYMKDQSQWYNTDDAINATRN